MIDSTPQMVTLSVNLHELLVEVPLPLPEPPHPADPLAPNISREQRAEPVPPEPHSLMTQTDTTLEKQVLPVPQRQRKSNVHHYYEPDHLRRRMEISKEVICLGHQCGLATRPCPGHPFDGALQCRLDRCTRHPQCPYHGDLLIRSFIQYATAMLGTSLNQLGELDLNQHREFVVDDPFIDDLAIQNVEMGKAHHR